MLRLPDREHVFEQLGDDIDRATVTRWASMIGDPDSAVDSFVVAMIWGYGTVGYGPYRTARILQAPAAAAELYSLASKVRSDGGAAAYEYFGLQRRSKAGFLKHLGPAFGTKFTYFVSKGASMDIAPVLDAVVQRWFRFNAPEVRLSLDWNDAASYRRYVAALSAWRDSLSDNDGSLDIDDVEYLIFTSRIGLEGSPWSEPWSSTNVQLNSAELLARLTERLEQEGRAAGAAIAIATLEELLKDDDSNSQ